MEENQEQELKEVKYDGNAIKKLSDRDHVRERAGMYIGKRDGQGLHHLLWEAVDNSIDEHNAGFCNNIEVTLHKDGSVTVEDDGRGIPTSINEQLGIPAVTIAVSMLNAGGKFNTNIYATSGGTHGIGMKACNFLSTEFTVTVMQNGNIYKQDFKDGLAVNDLTIVGQTEKTGTILHFNPDRNFLNETVVKIDPETKEEVEEVIGVHFDYETVKARLKALAYLNVGLHLKLTDERLSENNPNRVFDITANSFKEIVEDMQKTILGNVNPENIFPEALVIKSVEEVREKRIEVDVALNISNQDKTKLSSFTNCITNADGGTHERGFRQGLLRGLNKYTEANELNKTPFIAEDVIDGVFAAISIRIPEPRFTSQDKVKLDSTEATTAVQRAVMNFMERFFEENPNLAQIWVARAILAQKSRLAAKRSRESVRKETNVARFSLPGKLASCESNDPTICELFLVEGDSAGGSAKTARDRKTQAILPLRGKISNVYKIANQDKILDSSEINAIASALGVRPDPNPENVDLSRLRYNKVCIMADADVDGEHISALLLTFFHGFMRPLIEQGHVYICLPPLFRLDPKAKKLPHFYIQNQDELDAFFETHSQDDYILSRFKGLGEMNAEQLSETTLHPDSRTMLRVVYGKTDNDNDNDKVFDLSSALEAIPTRKESDFNFAEGQEPLINRVTDDTIFEILMGTNVPPRRAFLEANATYADDVS